MDMCLQKKIVGINETENKIFEFFSVQFNIIRLIKALSIKV